jgi:hypothetical protein
VLNKAVQQRLQHWRDDPDLVSVHDPSALDRLPDNDRAAWQALWHDGDALAKRVAGQDRTEGRTFADDRKKDRPNKVRSGV